MRQGLIAATLAYLIWGLFPIYWKLLQDVPAAQIMSHRIVWCLVCVTLWLAAREGFAWLRALPLKLWAMLTASALLIAINWWLYIWAVNAGHIVETSLGYFINPLVSVAIGVLVLRERLNRWQWTAIAVAALGVLWLTYQAGRIPWIALTLALSFAGYGLIRKLAQVPSVQGLAVESGVLLLPALAYLFWADHHGIGAFGHSGVSTTTLLVFGGVVTAIPLALFAIGARRIPLSLVGLLQYLAPTLQLACGVFLFDEPFTRVQAVGFGAIWLALLIYASDSAYRYRGQRRLVLTAQQRPVQ